MYVHEVAYIAVPFSGSWFHFVGCQAPVEIPKRPFPHRYYNQLFQTALIPGWTIYYNIINPRRACAARVTVVAVSVCVCVCVCVCLSVKSHLTSGASVRSENYATYSAGNEGRKNCGVFSETASFQSYGTLCIVWLPCSRPFSLGGIRACASKMPR